MADRKAFTLLEVLISIGLLGIVLMALFSSVDILQDSNQHLAKHLEKTKQITQTTEILYKDILSSDGNLTITKDEFTRLCMESTAHSLYALPRAKVCWVVMKEENTLARVEGVDYNLPTKRDDRVEVDAVMQNIELFDVYHSQDKVLVVIKETSKEAIKFMIQGITKPKPPKKIKKDNKKTKNNKKTPSVPSIPVPESPVIENTPKG